MILPRKNAIADGNRSSFLVDDVLATLHDVGVGTGVVAHGRSAFDFIAVDIIDFLNHMTGPRSAAVVWRFGDIGC